MEHKNIVATIYLKNGQAVKGMDNFEPMGWDVISLARLYNDSGIDKIIIFDLSDDDEEHEKNIHTIRYATLLRSIRFFWISGLRRSK